MPTIETTIQRVRCVQICAGAIVLKQIDRNQIAVYPRDDFLRVDFDPQLGMEFDLTLDVAFAEPHNALHGLTIIGATVAGVSNVTD